MQLVVEAFRFALERHSGQWRKDGSTPYIVHPFRVFLLLVNEGRILDETILASALLHDLIEDTKTDYDELEEKFGEEVANIVSVLSKDKRLPEKVREERYNEQLGNASWKAKVVKLVDIYDNLCDMSNLNPTKQEVISTLKERLEQAKRLGRKLPSRYKSILKLVMGKLDEMKYDMVRE